jgi:hypothetical protein
MSFFSKAEPHCSPVGAEDEFELSELSHPQSNAKASPEITVRIPNSAFVAFINILISTGSQYVLSHPAKPPA